MRRIVLCLLASGALLLSPSLKAVEYALPDLQGRMQSLQQYRGKWLVVNYWASWCKACLQEIPDLAALHQTHRAGDIAVLGINFEAIPDGRLRRFVEKHQIPYPILLSEPLPETPLGRVPALPTTYIIDPEGRVVAGQVGLVSSQHIEAYIAEKRQMAN